MNQPGYSNQGSVMSNFQPGRRILVGGLIIAALLAFEMFNFSTTEYSLKDLLGELTFLNIKWSIILSIAFCGIDFAGLARMFTPEQSAEEPGEIWYLFGAWLLAATMNAMLTWWGVSVAILNNPPSSNVLIDRGMILKVVPIFVAIMVWLIRVLIIGAFSIAGDRIFFQTENDRAVASSRKQPNYQRPFQPVNAGPATNTGGPAARPLAQKTFHPAAKPAASYNNQRSEPTYRPISMSATGHEPDDYPVIR